MAQPDPLVPVRPAARARAGCRWGMAFLALGALVMLLVCGAILFYVAGAPTYTLPTVVILDPQYGAEWPSSRTLLVLSRAQASEHIVKQELWVDGLLVYVARSTDPQGQKDFTATMSWSPKTGPHTLVARAQDEGGSVGVSDVVRVTVIDAGVNDQQPHSIQIAEQGDTLSSVGEQHQVTPEEMREANPDLSEHLAPGDWVTVPPGEGEGGRNDDHDEGVVQDPGADELPDNLPGEPADANPGFLGFQAPLLFWDTIVPWRDPRHTAPQAPKLKAVPGPNCSAVLTWWDASDNEKGFFLYRHIPGTPRFERIEPMFRAHNGNSALSYTDRGISGHVEYYVVAFNGAGESASRTVGVNVPGANCLREVSGQMLEIDMESLTAPGYEELYCYVALKGHYPFERVPFEQSKYLKWMSFAQVPHRPEFLGKWNLEEYYGGPNKRVVAAPPGGQSFEVEVECWGAAQTAEGGESFSLGSFDQSHPPEEWDGRALTGRGSSFTTVYHIRPWSGPAGNSGAALDPDIPAPYNLRPARDFNDCVAHTPGDGGSMFGCALANYSDHPPLVWEWDGVPEQMDGYRIYFNRVPVGGTFVPIDDMPKDFRVWAGTPKVPCGETWRYAVAAFDLNVESQMSEFIALGGEECDDLAVVEVELIDIISNWIDDGWLCTTPIVCLPGTHDTTTESYGHAYFWTSRGGQAADQRGGVSLIGPTRIKERVEPYAWANLPLCHNQGDSTGCVEPMGRNNNKLVLLVGDHEGIGGIITLIDEDLGPVSSGDDVWCNLPLEYPPLSVEEWASFDDSHYEWGGTDYGGCEVLLRVKGLGRTGSSHLVAPGGGGAAPSRKSANLRLVNMERNRAGNARLTVYNAGPDTLVQDSATLQFQAARVESGVGGAPTTIMEHEERAQLTIPAFGLTTFDTGQVLLEGFENRIRIVIRTDNFTDPDLQNNTLCRNIEVPDAEHVTIEECSRGPLTEGF